MNSIKVTGKDKTKVKIVCSGAGAAGLACMNLLVDCGVPQKNITLVDIDGVIHSEREKLTEQHKPFAHKTKNRTLAEALDGADYFLGLRRRYSQAGNAEDHGRKAGHLCQANPRPEIDPDMAKATRPRRHRGRARSDYPNQINNVLGFPYLFRGERA